MGYYVRKGESDQWTPRPFIIAEVLIAMGYGPQFVRMGRRPRWWPGTPLFRRLVSWKVATRRLQQHIDLTNDHPWAGPLVGFAVEEMGHRLAADPASISDRDLTDIITKLTRIFHTGAPSGALGGTPAPSAPGALPSGTMFRITRETIDMLPGPAQEKARRDLDAILVRAQAEIAPPAAPAE